MKWVFFILVALNLIIFGSTVTRQILKNREPITVQSQQQIVANNTPQRGFIASSSIKSEITPPPQSNNRIAIPMADNPEPKVEAQEDIQAQKKEVEEKRKKEEETLRRQKEKKKKEEQQKKKDDKKKTITEDAKTPDIQATVPKTCGQANITLPEDVYYRIRGLFSQWSNVAKRAVEKNPNAGKKTGANRHFIVIIPQTTNSKEDAIKLIALGYQPQAMGNLIMLGSFPTKEQAQQLRRKVQSSGINARVMEQITSNSLVQPLSIAVYHVSFMNLNVSDKQQLSKILQPYGKLQSTPACGK